MYQSKPQNYVEYREYFATLLQREEISDQKVGVSKIPRKSEEQLAQCIWYEKLLALDKLKTESNQALQIINPGRWNKESGPDFFQAELRVAGKTIKGDVEIHNLASDWEKHQHNKDPRYRKVILHAFMHNDDGKTVDCGYNGLWIERLNLGKSAFPDIETIRRSLSAEDYPYNAVAGKGRCSGMWFQVEPHWLTEFLDLAGRERMLGKVARLADCSVGESMDQVFYQAIMTTMGYKGAKALFFLLAKRTPVRELKTYIIEVEEIKRVLLLEAILLNVAQLIPSATETYDAEAKAYLAETQSMWNRFAPYFKDRIIPATKQWFTGIRPVNFPARRIAGMCHLLLRFWQNEITPLLFFCELFKDNSNIADKKQVLNFLHHLQSLFVVNDPADFWSWHCNLRTPRWNKPQPLIGNSRALVIVFNALIPIMILYAREHGIPEIESLCWRLFDNFPCLPDNVITRFMRYRLFNDSKLIKSLFINECRQQALFQIFYDCCNNNEVSCEDCYFLRRFELLGEEDLEH
ncbi:MAG: DUF2851 family protein [Candidatus Sumerlaeia bacterium]|nr:DUF2851 family protein [Candidatus Sumerlaeia bacterium]